MFKDIRKWRKHGNYEYVNRDFCQVPWYCQNAIFSRVFSVKMLWFYIFTRIFCFQPAWSWSLLCDFNAKNICFCLCCQSLRSGAMCLPWLLHAIVECFARLCHHLGVCLSVCLSVTLVNCIKMVQARITKSSPWTASRCLVFCDKILCLWAKGFPSNQGIKKGYLVNRSYFAIRYWLVWCENGCR